MMMKKVTIIWKKALVCYDNDYDNTYDNDKSDNDNNTIKNNNINNNAWVAMNNTFWSWVRWFANYFHEWRSQEWISLEDHITSDQKSLFTVTNISFYFLHVICVLNTRFR